MVGETDGLDYTGVFTELDKLPYMCVDMNMMSAESIRSKQTSLNAICPYFTMFPLDVPLKLIKRHADKNTQVLDPFCGRGTTNFAARMMGLSSIGVDVSPVATAIADSKIIDITPEAVVKEARHILTHFQADPPEGEFWQWAFGKRALSDLSILRAGLMYQCTTPSQRMLRAIIMGALHGPLTRKIPAYFSNQAPRTFAPKPAYSVRYWQQRGLYPREVDTINLVARRTHRYLANTPPATSSRIYTADGRKIDQLNITTRPGLFITSPPYYGMTTYIPDQWLRNWFIGGKPEVEYAQPCGSIKHDSPSKFVENIRDVWRAAANIAADNARLIFRFGGIYSRRVDPKTLAIESLHHSGWKITAIRKAGTSYNGKRQAVQFGARGSGAVKMEYNIYARN